MEWSGASATVAAIAIVLSVLSFAFTYLLDKRGHQRDDRIEKSRAYLDLELASIEVFKYKANHWDALHWCETDENPTGANPLKLGAEADAYFYQCLNLFEVASRYRREQVIEAEIYASWVAWFFETLEFSYFRHKWKVEYRDNYTSEIREIFDRGCKLDWPHGEASALREPFYNIVGDATGCDTVKTWRVPVPAEPVKNEVRTPRKVKYQWDDGDLAERAAQFAARVIGAQPSYISHSEIQYGFTNLAGSRWIVDLEERYSADFAHNATSSSREMVVAQDEAGEIVGIGILHVVTDAPRPYAVIEDMAVDPDVRGAGIGQQILEMLQTRASQSEAEWVYLESGIANDSAHRFFERNQFKTLSHVFGKRLARD